MNILIAVTGSVAAIKVPEVVEKLFTRGISSIKLAVTRDSQQFLQFNHVKFGRTTSPSIQPFAITGDHALEVYTDEMEIAAWSKKGDPIYHVELANWADVLVVLPLSANSLAKISHGLCDNLVTAIIRCWAFDGTTKKIAKPIHAFPCMNTAMWNHPVSAAQLGVLTDWGWTIYEPIVKKLACGEFGKGALMEVEEVVMIIESFQNNRSAAV